MRRIALAVLLLLVVNSLPAIVVSANVPSIISITRRTESGNTIVDVKVSHSDPSSTHFIAQINLDLDGTAKSFLDLPKATTVEATYSLNIGSTSPKLIKAQAVCNIHGAGTFYSEGGTSGTGGSSGGIPANPIEAVICGILAGVAILLIAYKRR